MRQFSLVFVLLFFSVAARADNRSESPESSNFRKTEKFLPGEEIVSPTGQRMKVWSTEGPVKVSPPPQPFQDPNAQNLNQSHILIDADAAIRRRDSGASDSFDMRQAK